MKKENYLLFLVAILTAVICHLSFSPYGFNPTDEGFVLSSSVRLLHGQIPHVDFSSLRPLGYAYLHIPELLISKDYTFLISRFVFWLEMSLIAYFWVLILQRLLSIINYQLSIGLFLITFIFNCHYFPIAVLHTIDGLLFALIGFYILFRYEKFSWLAGLFIGYSVLCKQGFVVLIPLIIFLFPQKKLALLFSFIPGIIYVAFVCFFGGWNDLITQLTAHSEIFEVGVLNYILNPFLVAGIIICILFRKANLPPIYILLLFTLSLLLLLITKHYHGKALLFLFGYVAIETFFQKENKNIYIVALVLAWSVSISVGYASIALFSGGLLSLLIISHAEFVSASNFRSRTKFGMTLGLVMVCLITFSLIRARNIYRDSPRSQLTYKLNGIVEGANGIYTNKQTYAVLKELDSLQHEYPKLLALPDFTACQLFDYKRPILTEWPNRAEIPNYEILYKVYDPLVKDSTIVIATPKYETALLSDSLVKWHIGQEYYKILLVENYFLKKDETNFFRVYRENNYYNISKNARPANP